MRPHWIKFAIYVFVLGLLAGCGGQVEDVTVTVTPSLTETATITPSPAAQIEPTATATKKSTITRTLTPTVIYTPAPTQPVSSSTETLLESLVWQDAEGLTGYPVKAMEGWEMGFRDSDYCLTGPYRWLDSEHLMLFPIIGHSPFQGDVSSDITQPVVASLDGSALFSVGEPHEFCQLPAWSQAAQRVIEAVEGEVRLRDLEGRVTANFPGKLPLELASSGLRLIAGDIWIDIESGEVVPLPGWQSGGHSKIGWTEDEQRIFGCCYSYADIRSGDQWVQTDFPGFFRGGRGSWPGEEVFSTSHWFADDTQVIVKPVAFGFISTQTNGKIVIPLFDPVERSYVDLITELDLGTPPLCSFSLAPQADRLWLNCSAEKEDQMLPYEEAYLVTLATLEVVVVPGQPEFLGWSEDGNDLIYNSGGETVGGEKASWLMTSDGESRRLADRAVEEVIWHPSMPLSVLRFDGGSRLQFVNVESEQIRQLDLEQPILRAVWEPDGAGIILITEEGRLLWLKDAFDAGRAPEPVTPPMPGLRSVRWSPDGEQLAFVSENVLFVVTIP
jgi:hypothetical protein